MGGFLGAVIAFARETVSGSHVPETRVDRDGTDAATTGHFSAPGDDAPPLPGDLAYLADDFGAGNAQAVGYQDPATVGVAAPGEKRIYARSGPGVVACEIWLKADGAIVIAMPLGSLAIDAAGNVTATTPLGTAGALTHTHTTPFGPSGPPIPNT